ncbi:MAG: hypothetical protein ACREVL_14870 [Solimonas sp.]
MRSFLFALAAVALLAGLFAALKPSPAPQTASAPLPAANAVEPRRFELTVQGSRLVAGPALIRVTQGDEVLIRVSSDAPQEMHVHGYDVEAQLDPGHPVELRFTATHTGRFEYELHAAQGHAELGVLEVAPR